MGAMETRAVEKPVFVEQAEYIEPARFAELNTEHPDEETILAKLSQAGAKLLTGPRGAGKTTLLLKAYERMLGPQSTSFPVYVNFKSSLRLEPLYRTSADASFWFNQWLLLKVYQGLFEALERLELPLLFSAIGQSKPVIDRVAGQLELGKTEVTDLELKPLDIPTLEKDVTQLLATLARSRCVLLLDDAAHAFSPEQQRDFFDFFRQLKSRVVAPKAAIYPGVTVYSSTFHVGHDAEEIDVWVKPHSPGYLLFMTDLLRRRLPIQIFQTLETEETLTKLLCYAAFGLPRSLLNMVRSLSTEVPEDAVVPKPLRLDRAKTLKAVHEVYENTMNLYGSLKIKLPMYGAFIVAGETLYSRMINTVKSYNRAKSVDRQSVTVAIQRPIPAELSKLIGFFQYSGLLLPRGEVSRGEKGVFELYAVHYAALIDQNAMLGRKAPRVADIVEAFERRHPHEFTRISPRTLLGTSDTSAVLPLSLPPCQVCGQPRVNESARFCPHCGSPLKAVSVFESLVAQDISKLPLTSRRVRSIKDHSRIRTIKDILMDQHDFRQLRSVPRIGPFWARRIHAYAEEYIA
jgi:ABC-type lipoprotein export system ATPase subunit